MRRMGPDNAGLKIKNDSSKVKDESAEVLPLGWCMPCDKSNGLTEAEDVEIDEQSREACENLYYHHVTKCDENQYNSLLSKIGPRLSHIWPDVSLQGHSSPWKHSSSQPKNLRYGLCHIANPSTLIPNRYF